MEQRVIFNKGEQREFLNLVKNKLNCPSIRALNQFGFKIPYSTLKDYYRERLSLPKSLFENLCYLSKINFNDLKVHFKDGNWGQIKAGKKGIRAMMKKYPEKLKEWRKKAMKNSPIFNEKFNLKEIKTPELNEKLAELIGAYLGDGTINEYQLKIAGDYRYDCLYHIYLSKLVYELFGIKASIKKEKNSNSHLLVVYSKNVCSFLNKNYNIKYGDKIRNKTIIPEKILYDKKLSIACLRGLIDTDGSISRRGRNGSQFCVQFTSHNKSLLKQVSDIGKNLGIFTFFDKTGAGTNKWGNITKYFRIVGSSNPKHVIRFILRLKGTKIYRNETLNYLKKDLYRNLELPFKMKGPVV